MDGTLDIRQTDLFKLFSQQLHPELEKKGFEVLENTWIDVSVHRFGIKYRRRHVDMYGQQHEYKVDFIGMPMGNILILCYGIIEGSGEVNAKIKIKSDERVEDALKRFRTEFVFRILEQLSPGLDDLPPELMMRIYTYLSVEDTLNLALVNKKLNDVCEKNDQIWKHHFQRDFPRDLKQLKLVQDRISNSWKRLYREVYIRRKRSWAERGLRAPDPILALPDVPRYLPILPAPGFPYGPIEPQAHPAPIPLGFRPPFSGPPGGFFPGSSFF